VKVVVSEQAKADLLEIRQYIGRDNLVAAKNEIARIKAAISLLATDKADGRNVFLPNGDSVRIWLVSSYRLYYRRTVTELQVLRVYHQARRPLER
jgi:plasmid stabilization system protein ParE